MAGRVARYRRIAALAEAPTPVRRLAAALVAGTLAFTLTQLLLGALWGVGGGAVLFSSVALAVAAAVAAVTTRWAMAVVYGLLGAIWLLLECFVALLGCFAVGLS